MQMPLSNGFQSTNLVYISSSLNRACLDVVVRADLVFVQVAEAFALVVVAVAVVFVQVAVEASDLVVGKVLVVAVVDLSCDSS